MNLFLKHTKPLLQTLRTSTISTLFATLWNVLLLYVVYSLCRLEYLLENWEYFAPSFEEGHLAQLFWGGVVLDTPGIMYTNALWIVLMMLPWHQKEAWPRYQKALKWLFLVVNGIATVLNLADSVYFRFTLRRSSLSVINEFSNEGTGEIGKILGTELLSHWYLVLMFIALMYGLWRLYMKPAVDIRRSGKVRYYVLQAIAFVAIAVVVVSGMRGGLMRHWPLYFVIGAVIYVAAQLLKLKKAPRRTIICAAGAITVALLFMASEGGWIYRDIRPVAVSNANEYCQRPTESALVLNTPFVLLRTAGKNVFNDPHYYDDKAQLDALFTPVKRPSLAPAEAPLAADSASSRKKNVVVIIIESFGREYIGGMNNGVFSHQEAYEGYTPFTDSLLQHSAWWRYSFCNGRKSIDGMPSILASIPMFEKPFILTPQAMNHIEGLPALLSRSGYDTAFFHGASRGSMGFLAFARSIGFAKYYGREDFEKDKSLGSTSDFDGYWAIWDEPWLQYYAKKMTQMHEPFMTAVFTATSHHPFQIPEKYEGRFKEGSLPIHKCIGYTDNALREFFNTARKQPWFKNTVFVITSDHTNMSCHKEYSSDIGGFMSPVIFYDPSGQMVEPGMRDGVAQQIDIMPTMLSLVGYDKPYVAFGLDLLKAKGNDLWAVNFLNGVYQYVRYGLVLQWDGHQTVGVYALDDRLMRTNLRGKRKEQGLMERQLKAIIQSYMDRMINDRLTFQEAKNAKNGL